MVGEAGGFAGVALVVGRDVEAALDELVHEPARPPEAGGAHPGIRPACGETGGRLPPTHSQLKGPPATTASIDMHFFSANPH